MPSFRWKVTVETNPGKDDASRTSARTASTCAPTDLRVDKQAAAFTSQEKTWRITAQMIFLSLLLSANCRHRWGRQAWKDNGIDSWWQGHTSPLLMVVRCTSRLYMYMYLLERLGQKKREIIRLSNGLLSLSPRCKIKSAYLSWLLLVVQTRRWSSSFLFLICIRHQSEGIFPLI